MIGIEARDKVLRPPAVLYWAGLTRHGIRLIPGSIGRYHASLDSFYKASGRRRSEGDESELIEVGRRNWHAGIPEAPENLPVSASFRLTRAEAEYLRERFVTSAPTSFLAWGLLHPSRLGRAAYPWEHPKIGNAPPALRQAVEAGRRFSLLMYGAVLVYNVALAELAERTGLRDSTLAEEYREAYRSWAAERIGPELTTLRTWDRNELWSIVDDMVPGRITRTRQFVERWMGRVIQAPASAVDDESIRTLIADREQIMKGSLARLRNRRALERWNGRSGLTELSYRWAEGRTLFDDISAGLRSSAADA